MSVKWCVVASAVTGRPAARRSPHHGEGAGGGQVLEVHPGAGQPGEGQVALDHQLLRLRRLAGQPEAAGPLPLVHGPALGDGLVLAVLGEDHVEVRRVLHRPAHQAGVLHAPAVVGEEPDAQRGHLPDRRQLLALPPDGDGAGDVDVAQRRAPEVEHLVDHRRRVDGRRGVGHGHERGVPAERSRPAAGLDGLRLFLARLAQVAVEVDEARRHDAAPGVDDLVGGEVLPHRDDAPVRHHDIGPPGAAGVDHRAAPDDELRHRSLPSAARPSRATGRARPCARRPRWPPGG